MRIFSLSLLSTLLLAGAASANDVYDRSFENGLSVYRGVTVHPDINAIQARAAHQARMEALKAENKRRMQAERERADLLLRQTEALENIAESVDTLSRRRGYGSNLGYGYGFGFNGIFTDSFPQTNGRVRLFAPGALRPRVVRGQVRY